MSRLPRFILVVAVAIIAIAIALAVLVYVIPPKSRVASAPRTTPSPSAATSAATLTCPPTELKLTGVFEECASIDRGVQRTGPGQTCPLGSPNPLWIVPLHGTKHDFLLYVEVNGIYHGKGTYALGLWPHDTFGVSDGVAKVAIREYVSGRLWESSAGSLTIDNLGDSGWVYAGLGASVNSPVQVDLNIAGWWACS